MLDDPRGAGRYADGYVDLDGGFWPGEEGYSDFRRWQRDGFKKKRKEMREERERMKRRGLLGGDDDNSDSSSMSETESEAEWR